MEKMKEENVVWQKGDLRHPDRLPIQSWFPLAHPNPVHPSRQAQQDVYVPPASHHLGKIRLFN